MSRTRFDPELDPGIKKAVLALNAEGIETFESCEGGTGHAYPVPTIRFHGEFTEAFRALAVALDAGLPVAKLRRIRSVLDGEPVGPDWELTLAQRTNDAAHSG